MWSFGNATGAARCATACCAVPQPSPARSATQPPHHPLPSPAQATQPIQHCAAVAVSLCFACGTFLTPSPAHAVLNSPNAQIARSTDVALRRSTPAFNSDVKAVQDALEEIQFQLRIPQRKPWGGMSRNVTTSLSKVADERAILLGTPGASEPEARQLLVDLKQQLERLQFAVERKDIDRTSISVANTLSLVNSIEVLQVPSSV